MIFKVVGGIPSPQVGRLWNSNTTQSENVRAALGTTTKYPGHLKNRVVLNWQTFNPLEVRKSNKNKLNKVFVAFP